MFPFSSLIEEFNEKRAFKKLLKVMLIIALTFGMTNSIQFRKKCDLQPNSCKFHGVCTERLYTLRGFRHVKVHDCFCNINCKHIRGERLCDNYHHR